jgi:hypothetical protein
VRGPQTWERASATPAVSMGRFAVIADPQGAPFAVFQGETDP